MKTNTYLTSFRKDSLSRMNWNPIRALTPASLSRILDDFHAGKLRQAALIWEAIQDNAGARISSEMSRENLSEKLLVEDIKLLKKQNLGIQGNEIDGNEIFAFYAQNGLLKDEPSNIKRFVTPSEEGYLFRVYVENHTKFTDITVEHYSNIVVTSNTNITQLNVKKQA